MDRHGFTGSYESVKRYAGKLRGTQTPEECGIIETAPGEESQVDYGTDPMQKRGPKSKVNAETAEHQTLRRENERLTEQLRKAELVIDVQKKLR